MDMHSEGLELLKDGIVLPHFRILSFFLSGVLENSYRILNINSHGGYVREVIDIMCPYDNIDYIGVDEDPEVVREAQKKKLPGTFRNINYDRMRLRSNSYDLIIAQNQFLSGDDLIEKMDNLFRASRQWIILFDYLVLPECDGSMEFEIDGKTEQILGVSHLRELFGIMEPTQLEYSFIVKNDNPLMPTPSIFVIKI